MFIVKGVLDWFYCNWFIVCCECFIHLLGPVGSRGEAPTGAWGGSPPEAGAF